MSDKKITTKIVVGAVITKDKKVLILQRHKNESVYPELWELPSGKREPLEPINGTLEREVREECGLSFQNPELLSIFEYSMEKSDEIKDSIQINFLAETTANSNITLSNEHQAYEWITEKEIFNYKISEATQKVIRAAFAKIEKGTR